MGSWIVCSLTVKAAETQFLIHFFGLKESRMELVRRPCDKPDRTKISHSRVYEVMTKVERLSHFARSRRQQLEG